MSKQMRMPPAFLSSTLACCLHHRQLDLHAGPRDHDADVAADDPVQAHLRRWRPPPCAPRSTARPRGRRRTRPRCRCRTRQARSRPKKNDFSKKVYGSSYSGRLMDMQPFSRSSASVSSPPSRRRRQPGRLQPHVHVKRRPREAAAARPDPGSSSGMGLYSASVSTPGVVHEPSAKEMSLRLDEVVVRDVQEDDVLEDGRTLVAHNGRRPNQVLEVGARLAPCSLAAFVAVERRRK